MSRRATISCLVVALLTGCATTPSEGSRRGVNNAVEPPERDRLALDDRSTCAVSDDSQIICWGDRPLGKSTEQVTVSIDAPIGDIAYDTHRLCAVSTEGALTCWGEHPFPRTNTEERHGGWVPDSLTSLSFESVALGEQHVCALTSDQTVRCAGMGETEYLRQHGDDRGQASPPTAEFRRISADRNRTCGVRTSGDITCWGHRLPQTPLPHTFSGTYIDVDVGVRTVCGVNASGDITCWGLGTAGDHYEHQSDFDQGVPDTGVYRQVSVTASHGCGVTVDGAVKCWGLGAYEDRFEGDHDYDQATHGLDVGGAVKTGEYHSCARHDGDIRCWGAGRHPADSDKAVRDGEGQSRVPSSLSLPDADDQEDTQ